MLEASGAIVTRLAAPRVGIMCTKPHSAPKRQPLVEAKYRHRVAEGWAMSDETELGASAENLRRAASNAGRGRAKRGKRVRA